MKTIRLMLAICVVACFSQRSMAVNQTMGLYLTADDYNNHKLSFETDGSNGNSIKLNEFLASAKVTVIYNGKKQSFSKSEIFGYKSNGQDYRYFSNVPYKILDTKYFYIYSAAKLMPQSKWSKPVNAYYFSTTANDEVKPLSVKNLESAYAENARFRYLVESNFATDNQLTTYDAAIKEYKVKYVFEQSASR